MCMPQGSHRRLFDEGVRMNAAACAQVDPEDAFDQTPVFAWDLVSLPPLSQSPASLQPRLAFLSLAPPGYLYLYIYIYVCMYVCMYAYRYRHIYIYIYVCTRRILVMVYCRLLSHLCMSLCVCVCVCIYVQIEISVDAQYNYKVHLICSRHPGRVVAQCDRGPQAFG